MPLRLIFMGTPEFAVPTLLQLIGQGHTIVAVYTRAPKAAGRGMKLRASPVEQAARRFGIDVLTLKSLRGDGAAAAFRDHHADVAVVVAYGLILPQAILDAPLLGCLNLHASLLPRWRGAAPISRAVMAGDAQSGVSIMKMDAELDTGPVALTEKVDITADMTAGELHDRLAPLGADLITRALAALERNTLSFTPQPAASVTYAHKIDKSETRVDWRKPWQAVHDHCRGLAPFPGAWFEFGDDPVRVKVLRTTKGEGAGLPGAVLNDALTIACGEGAIRLITLQRAGRQPMTAAEFLRGARLPPGSLLR